MRNTLEQIMDDTVRVAETYEVDMLMTNLMVLDEMRWRLKDAGASREASMLEVLLGANNQPPVCSRATAKGWLRRLMDVVDQPTRGEADALVELARARGLAQELGWA